MMKNHLLLASVALLVSLGSSIQFESAMKKFQDGLLRGHGKTPSKDRYAGRRRLQNGDIELSEPLLADTAFDGVPGFYHSVASGDPLPNAVIIWTRYTPVRADDRVLLEFRIAPVDPDLEFDAHLDPSRNPALRRGTVMAVPESDWVVKLDMTGLNSNTKYVYAFTDGDQASDVGLTRTAPGLEEDVPELRYAVFSCSNFPVGHFHAYDKASTIENLDLWVHTGDYFYEYGTVFSEPGPRVDPIMPIWEIVDLQDYRLRHASYVHGDEGLRNLRKSTPLMSSWDDHETTNNSHETGAQNHQPVCPANRTSSEDDIRAANCDRDEGDAGDRFNAAFQAYMEWMPVRYQEGTMGQIDLGSFTQVVEWGRLATFVTFDTRVSYRSEDPTVGQGPLDSFGVLAATYTNVSEYSDPATEAYAEFQKAANEEIAIQYDPQYSMIGDYIDLLRDTFGNSTEAGKPWQIWAANVMVGPYMLPDVRVFPEVVGPALEPVFAQYLDTLFSIPEGGAARAVSALAEFQVPSNRDSFVGFSSETVAILDIAKNANNMVILGGDVHDSYAWILYEEYELEGTPVAVNLVCPGVTSNGLGPAYAQAFGPIQSIVGDDVLYASIDAAGEATNPGLVFTNQRNKGFYAVSVTPDSHTAEYFLLETPMLMTNYSAARDLSEGLTADMFCASSLTTGAGEKGSLVENSDCSAITFVEERNAVFDLPVPITAGLDDASFEDCGYKGCTVDPFVLECLQGELVSNSITDGSLTDAMVHDTSYDACGSSVSHGVWYQHSGDGSLLTVEACSTDFEVQVAVFSGDCTDSLCIGLAQQTNDCVFFAWPTTEGEEYSVLVHSLDEGANGTYYVDFDSLKFVM